MKKRTTVPILLLLILPFIANAHLDTLSLAPSFSSFIIAKPYFVELEDPTGHLSFEKIVRDSIHFYAPRAKHFTNPHISHSYWFKIKLANKAKFRELFLVSHNYGLSEIDVYKIGKNGDIDTEIYNRKVSVYKRTIINRQPVFKISMYDGEVCDVFIRVRNTYSSEFTFELYSSNNFFSHYTIEYLLFGMFYGMLIFVVLYNITLYISLKQNYSLALVIFNIIQIITLSFRDGNSVFLFPGLTNFTLWTESLFLRLFFLGLTIFCILFLNLSKSKRITYFLLGINGCNLLTSQLNFDSKDFFSYHLDILILGCCTLVALYKWMKGEPLAKFVFAGLISLFTTYFIYYLSVFDVISVYYFSFFSLYVGVVAESIFLTFASSEKIKLIRLGHINMERMNKDLELKVEERTKIIKEQNEMLELKAEELNQFLYKSSHDLKGPIKSIEGLCNVALLEQPEKHKEYIQRINERTKVLGGIVSDLNQVIIANNAPVIFSEIDFKALHESICKLFEAYPGYSETQISFQWNYNSPFFSDSKLVASIYQNLLENGIKYRDPAKKSTLNIVIDDSEEQCTLVFKDNGVGIQNELKDKVFDMFFKANDTFQDSNGLGLYLVKVSVEKLRGNIGLESDMGIGTTIRITFAK